MTFNSSTDKFIFYYIPIGLFSLIPFLLITGPFLSDLSVSLISLLFVIYCIKQKNFSYFNNKFFYFFLLFWIYLLINSFINNLNTGNFGSTIVYIRHGIFFMAIVTLLNFNNKFIYYFFYCIFICFSVLIIDGFYQYFAGKNILGWISSSRTSSFFGEEKILGSYVSRLWPIFFGLSIFIFERKNKIFFILILVFILSYVLIFLSGDRSAFFNINLSAIFILLFSQKLFKLRLLTLIISIFILLIISFINPTAKERIFDQTIDQMKVEGNEKDSFYIFSKQHTHHYITAYRMFLDNKVFGVGIKNFRTFCSDEKYQASKLSCSTHPHNAYIQILSETGIIGLLFILFVLFYFCKYIFKHLFLKLKKKYYFTDFEICILSGIAIYLWPLIPTGNLFTNWLSILMFINVPFLIWSLDSKKINLGNN